MRRVLVLAAAAILLMPRAVLACPICFGQNDSPMSSAISYGVIAMLGVVAAVLGAFASFIVYLNQRARLASDMSLAGEPTAGAGRYPPSNPQEGTV